MSVFEYVFTFYGLLLGLAAANVATGFADMWTSREMDSPGPWQMISLAAFALPYVFISRAMFPGAGGATSLEGHIWSTGGSCCWPWPRRRWCRWSRPR